MASRRAFIKGVAGATAGMFVGRGLVDVTAGSLQTPPAARRQVLIGGRRIRTIDMHTHTIVPEVRELVRDYDWGRTAGTVSAAGQASPSADAMMSNDRLILLGPERLRVMDQQGIDTQAVMINPFWYTAEHEIARDLITLQNEKMAANCAAHPDRFVAMASVALQYPYLAADQLDEAVRKLGMRGAGIGGSVEGQDLSMPKFDPFWAKAEELGVVVVIHPQGLQGNQPDVVKTRARLEGRGGLGNTIGNPLETTIALSHLIVDGTLDRFPGLKICACHAGGYLPSYMGRTVAGCGRGIRDCRSKKPAAEYLKTQIYIDSVIFTPEGLRHLVAESGVGQVVIGTDFPYEWNPVGVDPILGTPSLGDADRVAILSSNAAKLLKLT